MMPDTWIATTNATVVENWVDGSLVINQFPYGTVQDSMSPGHPLSRAYSSPFPSGVFYINAMGYVSEWTPSATREQRRAFWGTDMWRDVIMDSPHGMAEFSQFMYFYVSDLLPCRIRVLSLGLHLASATHHEIRIDTRLDLASEVIVVNRRGNLLFAETQECKVECAPCYGATAHAQATKVQLLSPDAEVDVDDGASLVAIVRLMRLPRMDGIERRVVGLSVSYELL